MQVLAHIAFLLVFWVPQAGRQDTTVVKPAPKALKNILEKVIADVHQKDEIDLEIDGLLMDETKTKAGRDFYDLFYANWTAPPNARNFTITIEEKPFRLTTTLIVVSINDNIVFQSLLQPRQDILEDLSAQAISFAYEYLQNYEEIMRQLNGDDQAGTGIY